MQMSLLTKHFTQLRVVQVRVLLREPLALIFRPHHERVHRPADARLTLRARHHDWAGASGLARVVAGVTRIGTAHLLHAARPCLWWSPMKLASGLAWKPPLMNVLCLVSLCWVHTVCSTVRSEVHSEVSGSFKLRSHQWRPVGGPRRGRCEGIRGHGVSSPGRREAFFAFPRHALRNITFVTHKKWITTTLRHVFCQLVKSSVCAY